MLELPRILVSSKAEAISLIGEQIKRGRQIRPVQLGIAGALARYHAWDTETFHLLKELFDTDKYAKEFQTSSEGFELDEIDEGKWRLTFHRLMETKVSLLKEFQRRIDKHLSEPNRRDAKQMDFWPLIHPEIVAVTKERFEARQYADCAEAAFKQINTRVKEIVKRAKNEELDGADLMRKAFSANDPIITIETIATNSGQNIQQGFMEIFAGSMTGIRNPKAHEVIDIGAERAIHFIFLASLLMDTIDIAYKNYRF